MLSPLTRGEAASSGRAGLAKGKLKLDGIAGGVRDHQAEEMGLGKTERPQKVKRRSRSSLVNAEEMNRDDFGLSWRWQH